MNIYCWQSDEDNSKTGERPKWSDLPEAPIDENPPSPDPNQQRIDELQQVPQVIIKERRKRTEKLWN